MIGWWLSAPICQLVGIVYPGYRSFKAVKTEDKEDDTQWLMYWVCLAAFTVFEFFADRIISFLPFYWEIKVAFLVWLQHPSFLGATFLYKRHLEPLLNKHESRIDQKLAEGGAVAMEATAEAIKTSLEIYNETKKD
eukprot:GCRY01000430.1.p1 GENE.GCRY01000430.1~~GCRY01000430.1.p1  ORF type:complete len:136 (-),score=7.36 GCRY01000430.1:75-482(-)